MIYTKELKERIKNCNKIIYDKKEEDCKVDIGAYGGIMVMIYNDELPEMQKFKYLREEEDKIAIKSIPLQTTHYLIKP